MPKVLMQPYSKDFGREESGIRRVVEAYEKYMPQFGWEFVEREDRSFDLVVGHVHNIFDPDVLVCHGLYWTADYDAPKWEWMSNKHIIDAARHAKQITVPSSWVAEAFERGMRLRPTVVPHGIDFDLWEKEQRSDVRPYVLWNKNRADVDVCNTRDLEKLAGLSPSVDFLSTFASPTAPTNVNAIGLQPHATMRRYVKSAGVYLSTIKETFGIGVLEAMASGVPVLGWKYGGNVDLIQHGVNGFLAEPGDWDGLREGLDYCLRYRKQLGANGIEIAREYTWEKAVKKMSNVWNVALTPVEPNVTVIIPCYNYGEKVGRAIESALNQTVKPFEIIVVDDGSSAEQSALIQKVSYDLGVSYIHKDNGGVATARNAGIRASMTPYVCCLDADDMIEPTFLEVCLRALEEDNSLGIAYTGLKYIMPDGRTGISQWPGDYNYDDFLNRKNQVPTCCVFRMCMWEQLGGYNQKYAPTGAGSEDAEFFLRAGAFGFGAKKVTDEGLFVYSAGTGHTSKPGYSEVDWMEMHPWTRDGLHPIASLATPKNKISHPVTQYDEPIISVVIPVGPGHIKQVRNALDSLETQGFRKWEVIVVWDMKAEDWDEDEIAEIQIAYPFMHDHVTLGQGAGAARNYGVSFARGNLLLFLDADDWLYPNALQKMYDYWQSSGGIIYSDYVGKAFLEEDFAEQMKRENRLLSYNTKTKEAVMAHKSAEYDCQRAINQPDPNDMYIWNLITSLVPRVYHNEIGGFDEDMQSWEDWDYWIRMARAGKCFYHLPEELVVYRFYTGNRRETGLQQYPVLIQYLQKKYSNTKGSDLMPCTGCSGNRGETNPSKVVSVTEMQVNAMADTEFVLIQYDHPNLGQHRVIGAATGTFYGYRGGGEQFYAHIDDIKAQPHIYKPIARVREAVAKTEVPPPPNGYVEEINTPLSVETKPMDETIPPPPPPSFETNDLQAVPGISDVTARELNAIGIYTVDDLDGITREKLLLVKGIGSQRATIIMDYLKERKK